MDNYLQEVGARIKEARLRKHLSQAQLAELLGLTPPYISNIETGKQNMKAARCSEGVLNSDFALHCSFHTLNCSSIT